MAGGEHSFILPLLPCRDVRDEVLEHGESSPLPSGQPELVGRGPGPPQDGG